MITLLYAGNKGVFDGLLISSLSAAKICADALDIVVLTMDLTEQNEKYIPISQDEILYIDKTVKEYNPKSHARLIDIGEYYKEQMLNSPNAQTSYTPYTFLRLYADMLDLPKKVLYLDTDTVVCGDLSEIYNIDIEKYELAASLDYYGKIFMGINYFNAGVILLNLENIKKSGLFKNTVALCAKKKIFLPDQTALNRLVKKKLIIPRKFNEQKRHDRYAVIQHFTKTIIWFPFFHTRNIKPWQTEHVKSIYSHNFDNLLDEYIYRIKSFKGDKSNEN